jgi:hypothetical protein
VTAAALTSLTGSHDEGAVTVGNITAAKLKTLSITDAAGAGAVTYGDVAAAAMTDVTLTNTGTATVMTLGASTLDNNLNNFTAVASGTGEFVIGAITADASAAATTADMSFTIGATQSAATTVGNIDVGTDGTIGTFTWTQGASDQANTVGTITASEITNLNITSGDDAGSTTFAGLAGVTTLGTVTIDTDDTLTFTIGATTATSIGSITVTSKLSDVNLGTWGVAGSGTSGTVGDITFKGSSSTGTDLTVGAVLSVGAVSTAAATAGTYTIILSDTTVIGTTMTGGAGIDIFTGTGGADVISTGAAADTLNGGSGDDTLTDAAGASSASGGAGADTISMGAGNDSINGGAGNDTITGGAGTDTIVAADDAANGLDTVVLNVVDGTTILDIIDLQANGAFVEGATEDVKVITDVDVTSAVGDEADGDNILILTGDFFANAAALVTATTLFAAMDTGDIVIIYSSDATSDARLAVATIDAAGDITAATDNIIFTGLTVAEAATGFANANFVI